MQRESTRKKVILTDNEAESFQAKLSFQSFTFAPLLPLLPPPQTSLLDSSFAF